ncbi:MAG: OmpA family protein [Myxococcota bacterium]
MTRAMPKIGGIALAFALALASSGGGCVAKGRHEITEVQLAATRTALSAQTARYVVDAHQAELDLQALRAEIDRRQLQLDELIARGDARDAELDRLQAERLALLDAQARAEAELTATREALAAATAKKNRGKPAVPVPLPATVPEVVALARAEVVAAVEDQFHTGLERQRLDAARIAVEAAFAPLVAEGRVEVLTRSGPGGDTPVVRIRTGMLFQEGFSTLSPRGQQIVDEVAAALGNVPGRFVTIEGHTDDRPVHSAEFPSNWERAFAHAVAVLRGLEGAGAKATLSAASFAGTRPLVPNDTPEHRAENARVELVIEVDPALATAFAPTPPEEPPVPTEPGPTEPGPTEPGPEAPSPAP